MGWIQNISMLRVMDGDHMNPGSNSMLIQIVDPAFPFPVPLYDFKEVHQFEFLDLEEHDDYYEEAKITPDIAFDIIWHLTKAVKCGMNVIVHCHMGHCRSGAVCEVGVMMGLEDLGFYRNPNTLVKKELMRVMGWAYE
jgi:predicted protein tyrosine phosphatase